MDILIIILLTSLIWLLVAVAIYIYSIKRIQKTIIEANEKLKLDREAFASKLEGILSVKNKELQESYAAGYKDSQDKKELSVQVSPWKEEVDSSNFFKNKRSIKIGYKYQLFSNGLPCLEPHTIVVDELSIDKLNEENIERAFSNLEMIMNSIPNTGSLAVKILGNGREWTKSLLRLAKKKK